MLTTENNYVLDKNKYFLNWFQKKISYGYDIFLDISDLQKFIDYTTFWYESRFPERGYETSEYDEFGHIKDVTNDFSYSQLMYRIDEDMFDFLKCEFRSDDMSSEPYYDDSGNIVYLEKEVNIEICSKDKGKYEDMKLVFDADTGVIKNPSILIKNGIYVLNNITINKLLYILNSDYEDYFELSLLKQVVRNHKYDLQLRKILLTLTANKILSNDDVRQEVRFLRYRAFINDFNDNIYGLKLNFDVSQKEDIKKLLMK